MTMNGNEEQLGESTIKKGLKMLGGNMTKERRREMYFGRPPKGIYPTNRDAEHIHDLRFSPKQISEMYGIPQKEELALEALHSDSRSVWVKELMDAGLDRRAAEQTINSLVERGVVEEIDEPDLGKVLILRRR